MKKAMCREEVINGINVKRAIIESYGRGRYNVPLEYKYGRVSLYKIGKHVGKRRKNRTQFINGVYNVFERLQDTLFWTTLITSWNPEFVVNALELYYDNALECFYLVVNGSQAYNFKLHMLQEAFSDFDVLYRGYTGNTGLLKYEYTMMLAANFRMLCNYNKLEVKDIPGYYRHIDADGISV